MYPLEINQSPEEIDPERKNLLSFIHIREKKERMKIKKRFTETMVSY